MKYCSDCKTTKEEKEFSPTSYICHLCARKRTKIYYQKNKEKILKRQSEYRKNNKEKLNELRRARYPKNKEKLNEYRRKYYKKNKDKFVKWIKNFKNLKGEIK